MTYCPDWCRIATAVGTSAGAGRRFHTLAMEQWGNRQAGARGAWRAWQLRMESRGRLAAWVLAGQQLGCFVGATLQHVHSNATPQHVHSNATVRESVLCGTGRLLVPPSICTQHCHLWHVAPGSARLLGPCCAWHEACWLGTGREQPGRECVQPPLAAFQGWR
jgi:hypothetical protein